MHVVVYCPGHPPTCAHPGPWDQFVRSTHAANRAPTRWGVTGLRASVTRERDTYVSLTLTDCLQSHIPCLTLALVHNASQWPTTEAVMALSQTTIPSSFEWPTT